MSADQLTRQVSESPKLTDDIGNLSIGRDTDSLMGGIEEADTPRLVYTSSKSLVYRQGCGIMGNKIILNPSASDIHQHKLDIEHEQLIFNHLPSSFHKRNVTKVEEIDGGNLSIHFEWIEGMTLEDWLQLEIGLLGHQSNTTTSVLKTRLAVAIGISKSLLDYHDSGVACNNLSPSNIIVEKTGTDTFEVNFINFSKSILFREVDESAKMAAKQNDLQGLGRVFQILFGARQGLFDNALALNDDTDQHMNNDEERKKKTKISTEHEGNEGLPLYLVALIAGLLKNKEMGNYAQHSGEQYVNVKDVLHDLKAGVEKFDIYFRPFDWKEASLMNQLPVLPGAYYGRKPEISILMNSLHSVVNYRRPIMAVVRGHGGMGKSYLVKTLENENVYFIIAKFDINGCRPDSVLFEALDLFFGKLTDADNDNSKSQMIQRIHEMVGFGIADLIQSIPNLRALIGDASNIFESKLPISTGEEARLASHRRRHLLCRLIAAIGDAKRPLVLVFDDMQWADDSTLSMIQAIVTDPDMGNCLFVGCYRDINEIGTEIQLKASASTNVKSVRGDPASVVTTIDEIKAQNIRVFECQLGPFDKETVNDLVSESMCLPSTLSKPLSTILHSKTQGNPLLCVNFLGDGIIRFNLNERRWDYNIKDILAKEIPESVVQYMKNQMSKLPQTYCLVLKLASCLGTTFDIDTFSKAKVRTNFELQNVLPSIVKMGFIHEVTPGKFLWAHDQVRMAAYELIPKDKKKQFHLLIATRLLINTAEADLHDDALFIILYHMNKGLELIQTEDQIYEVARLNLLAGETSITNASFYSAAEYLTLGVKILPDTSWEEEYALTLNLHDAAQESLFVSGDFHTLRQLSATVIAKARSFDDKLNSYNNLVRYLVSSEQLEEAISTCSQVLAELGEPFPQVTNEACYEGIVSVKTSLAKYSSDEILGLEQCSDVNKLAAMEFLQCILLATFNSSADSRLGVLLVVKLIQISLEHGLCEASSFGFALWGTMLVHGNMKDLDGGYFYGSVAIKLLEHLRADRFKARVYTMVYGLINIWKEPFQASLECLLEGYSAGQLMGDVEYAFRSAHMYSEIAFLTGQNLTTLEDKMRSYAQRALQIKQLHAEFGIVPYLSAAVKLMGDPNKGCVHETILHTTEEQFFQLMESKNNRRVCFVMLNIRKLIQVFQGDMSSASDTYNLILSHPIISSHIEHIQTMPYIMGALADGIIAFYCARKSGASDEEKQKWAQTGIEKMKTFREWEKRSDWSFGNKTLLLEAEYYSFMGKHGMATEKYSTSIASAKEHRFIHEEGLANYLCGQYHLSESRRTEAQSSFLEAKKCYTRWGALALAERMDILISDENMKI